MANNGFGQDKITLNLENVPLKKVFKAIEKQTSFRFVYSDDAVPVNQKTSISVKSEMVNEVMKKLFENTALTFKLLSQNLIVISNNSASVSVFAVSGKVVNARNEPMANVSVLEKGTNNGTVTKEDGNYTINVTNENARLVFSYVGFLSEEVAINGRSSIGITLNEDTRELNQVVVVGYGTQRRADITGSVSSVPKSRLSELPVTNLFHAIEGSVAGVGVVQNSAVPGRTATVQVRGLNSITANTSPLLVIDGIPLSQDASINDINSNDVASIEILKDASAVAIYGVRGSNGVILITTKRGGSAKPVIRYSGYAGPEDLAHILEPSSPQAYLQKWLNLYICITV